MNLLKIINGKLHYARQEPSGDSSTTRSDTHTSGGATEYDNSSSASAVTNPQLVADQRDQLANDLIEIVNGSIPTADWKGEQREGTLIDTDNLMQKLVIYLGERDQRVLQHGVNLGKRDFSEIHHAIELLKGWLELSANATSNPKIAALHRRSQDYVENV